MLNSTKTHHFQQAIEVQRIFPALSLVLHIWLQKMVRNEKLEEVDQYLLQYTKYFVNCSPIFMGLFRSTSERFQKAPTTHTDILYLYDVNPWGRLNNWKECTWLLNWPLQSTMSVETLADSACYITISILLVAFGLAMCSCKSSTTVPISKALRLSSVVTSDGDWKHSKAWSAISTLMSPKLASIKLQAFSNALAMLKTVYNYDSRSLATEYTKKRSLIRPFLASKLSVDDVCITDEPDQFIIFYTEDVTVFAKVSGKTVGGFAGLMSVKDLSRDGEALKHVLPDR